MISIMNIEESDPMPLTEGNRALQLFTDRNEITKRFAEYLNEKPPCEKILFFLLKFLREKCMVKVLRLVIPS